jgi:hypothetical protein
MDRGRPAETKACQQRSLPMLESLERRQLFSAIGVSAAAISPVTLTIDERAGVKFTANLGHFSTPTASNTLEATISWGDGTTSKGTLKELLTPTTARLTFEVDGTHKYKKAGTYDIQVNVLEPGPSPTTHIRLVASFDDTAIVARKHAMLD